MGEVTGYGKIKYWKQMNPKVSENLQKAQFPSLTRIQSFFSVRSKCSVPEAIILAFGLVQLS